MHLVPDEMVVAQEVQMFQGASKTCCPGGKHSGANHPLGIESLTRICRQAKGGAFSSFFVTASNLQLKPYFSSRVPAVKSLPCTTSLLVHAVQEQAAPTKGLKDSDVRTQPESNRERGDEDRSSRRRTLRAFRGGRVLPRRIDCLVSETAVAARWSDPGYAYPPAARGRTAGAANLIKHVAEEKGEEYGGKGGRLGERLNAVNSGADVGAVFEETRIGERVAVANVPRTRDRHSDFERQGDPSESHPPDLEAEDFGSGAWYPDAFVADSSWGGDQADLVQRILGPPGAVPVAKRPTINLSETMEMFRDRSTEGSFNPPSTSYGGSRDGLSRSTRREYWGALQGSAGEKFGREPNIGRGSGPEVDVLGRLKSTGSPPGGGFFEQRGEKDVWRRGGRISEGARKGDTWEEDLRSKGVMRDEGGGLEDHLRTGQRRGLLGQPRGSRRCVRDEDVVGGFMVPSVERVLGIEAGATHRKSGTGAELEPRFKSGFGVESDTGFGHNFKSQVAARESGLESRSQPESNVDVLDEELELFVERLGGMGNIAPASEASQEAGAFESISPRLDLGFARSDVSGGRFAPNGVRGVDKVTWSAQDRRSWTSPESSAEKMDDVLQSGDVQSFGASPFDTEPSLGVQNRPASRETPTFETRRWTSQPLDKPPSANIPPSDPSSPVEVLAPPSRNVLQPDPSHLVWGEKQELPPTAFYDEHFLERFQYTRPPPNRNLPLFLDIKGHDTSPELPMPPPYYNRNSTHEKSGEGSLHSNRPFGCLFIVLNLFSLKFLRLAAT